jgi:S-adenosylmethionine hydrolase
MRPVISLTTDFGLKDHFVGTMKGVIAEICPDANVIDITHEIPAFDVLEGALAIWPAWRYFPAGTVHVVVVDPGVGTERRPILARLGGHYFIAPDNGLLTLLLEDIERTGPPPVLHELTTPAYKLGTQSLTFHGRDVFAPAAAHLAKQLSAGTVDLTSFGPRIEKPLLLKTNRLGNLLTNLQSPDAQQLHDRHFVLELKGQKITRHLNNYMAGEASEPFAILGSSGLVEIALNRGSAAKHLGALPGDPFILNVE